MVKSELVAKLDKTQGKQKYPYLGLYAKDKDFVVLFLSEDTGVVVQSRFKGYSIGHYDIAWEESDCFTPLPKGFKVILEQE